MTEEISGMIKMYAEIMCDHNMSESVVMEIIKAAELRRASDALERIAGSLDNLDSMEQSLDVLSATLSDAVVKNRYGSAIAITGSIDTM